MIVFNDNTIGALEFTVTWEQDNVIHEEWFLGRKFNPVNDIFPRGMREALEGKTTGESVTLSYEPRMCIPRYRENLVQTLNLGRLRSKTRRGDPIIPRQGRFYPQGHINGLLGVYAETLTPFRLTELDDNMFTADCNHPLAKIPVTITAKIQCIEERKIGTFGSLSHWREKTCDWGPGMQTRLDDEPTDFFHPAFFDQQNPIEEDFLPPRPDTTALMNINRIYARFIEADKRILDYSLGTDRPTGQYDAAICTCSVEYMDRPVDILRYVAHYLTPGAPMLLAFTHAFDPVHTIQGWQELHAFERMGLVLEYLRMAGLDTDLGTVSIRNDWRAKDDPHFLETKGVSAPVFVVYGHKA